MFLTNSPIEEYEVFKTKSYSDYIECCLVILKFKNITHKSISQLKRQFIVDWQFFVDSTCQTPLNSHLIFREGPEDFQDSPRRSSQISMEIQGIYARNTVVIYV